MNDAATRAFEDNINISQELLENVIKENVPSVTEKDISFYNSMKKEMESIKDNDVRRPVGFR